MLGRLHLRMPSLKGYSWRQAMGGNRYNRMELAGAFGDLGTLIPFLVGYITIFKLDPLGILVAFGLCKILVGLYYKTPVPVQPMKFIGGAAITQSALFTPGMVWGAGVVTGLLWLALVFTGSLELIARITTKPVIRGLMLGLGLRFVLDGAVMMSHDPLLAVPGAALTLLFLTSQRYPAMLVLLIFGISVALFREPGLVGELARSSFQFRLPALALGRPSVAEVLSGAILLALPQVPLTLGNAIIATTGEHNAIFPGRPVSERRLAISTGLMNLLSFFLGGVPMCHGAGGLAGHVRFGARTGGALVMLEALVLALGLFFSDAVSTVFRLFPEAILGVILAFAGAELASVIRDIRGRQENIFVLVITAGIGMWHIGYAFLVGLLLFWAIRLGAIRV